MKPTLNRLSQAVLLALPTLALPVLAQQTAYDADTGTGAPKPQEDAVRLGTVSVSGRADRVAAGQMLQEDAVKARSTVTRSATEKDRATGNPYQALSLLPGVNTFSYDATGLFGGGITVRGFNSDQLGVTINGVPVNDSSNFAVYPQEYADQENLCTQSINPGVSDVETPHIGASGGGISLTTCDPEDKARLRAAQTVGQLKLSRTYLRGDTGWLGNKAFKGFASYSHTQADKWKGSGGAKRDHVDVGFSLNASERVKIVGSVLYNRAINNNIGNLSLAQLNANGYYSDFASSFNPGHLPGVNGMAQKETGPNPVYYGLSLNPFENAIASLSTSIQLAEKTRLKFQPYYWYGYGTGGNQQRAQSETGFLNTATGKVTAGVDLNKDGDTLDTVIVANSSVTRTSRPGITGELTHEVGSHHLKLGLWYERAQHRQTGPMVPVDANGNPSDVWLRNGLILRPDGTPLQSRDWLSVSPASQVYASDSIHLVDDRALITLGLRAPHIKRRFTNYPSEASNSQTAYTFEKTYTALLPQLGGRFQITDEHQVFANVGKTFRAPPNFAFAPSNSNIQIVNGQPVLVTDVSGESAITTDLGYRYQGNRWLLSATLFNSDFKNRQSNAVDPATLKSVYTNVGNTNKRGLELEAGTSLKNGFSAYASLTAQREILKSDITVTGGQALPLTGKKNALVPDLMVGLALQYSQGPFYVRLKTKYTGQQQATLMNDEPAVPAYTVADLDAGYTLPDAGPFKSPTLRLNIGNVGNARYRNPSSGQVLNAQAVGSYGAGTVYYYLGAPRFVSMSLQADIR